MAAEEDSDEYGREDTSLGQDFPEPDAEPLCWTHHSNSCDCQPENQEQGLDAGERFSTEPPFGPDDRPVIDDHPLKLPAW